ncbi:MAG: serine acetyltransferase [Melioribacteraceae bacterium]|nr:serine acetyltransferase [Melioribacteraceae bacterium]
MKTNFYENSKILSFAESLLSKRQTHNCTSALKRKSVEYVNDLLDFLFPHFSERIYYTEEDVIAKLQLLKRNLINLISMLNGDQKKNADKTAEKFIGIIPDIHNKMWSDAEFINSGDPASENIDEVILAYPGFMAIAIYRIAHELYELGLPVIPRVFAEYAHQITGVDIHPGAAIGTPFFIDHATGVVIGETTRIGNNVKIYQGVTLGALSVDKKLSKKKRHPTIEDNVIIYAQAVILGGETIIGSNSVIGGNSWITKSIPPNSVVNNNSQVRVRAAEQLEEPINFSI